jgi:hypothetical protein
VNGPANATNDAFADPITRAAAAATASVFAENARSNAPATDRSPDPDDSGTPRRSLSDTLTHKSTRPLALVGHPRAAALRPRTEATLRAISGGAAAILLSMAGFATAHMLLSSDDRQQIPVCLETPACPSARSAIRTPTETAAPRAAQLSQHLLHSGANRTASRPQRKKEP